MTNNALEAITTAVVRVDRLLATFEVYADSVDLNTVGQSNKRITELVCRDTHMSELGIQAALDHVDGENLTSLDFALDEVRRTRQEYYSPVEGSAARAFGYARSASAHVREALNRLAAN